MATFKVESGSSVDQITTRDVNADYYVHEDGFVTFKDSDHKQVASFNYHNVISIEKAATKPLSIGAATVTITPVMDEAAFTKLMQHVESRVKAATGTTHRA